MKIFTNQMEKRYGYLQGTLDCVDESIRNVAVDYKNRLSRLFSAMNSQEISSRIRGNNFYVSKKIDGHLQLVIFNGEDIFMIGRGGIVRTGLGCLEQAKKYLTDHHVTSMIAAAELYQYKEGERSRVYDTIAALADPNLVDSLALAFFDILEINGESFRASSYDIIYHKLVEIFPESGKAHRVETQIAKTPGQIQSLFAQWVEKEGAEGLVVRGDIPFIYKIKKKLTVDVVVVGYVEGMNEFKGKVKTLLFAVVREPNIYQIIGKVGTMSLEERQFYFDRLSQQHVDSSYIETDTDGVAFHMVFPEMIIEVGCNDIMTENTYGKPLINNVIQFDGKSYRLNSMVPGVRFIHPVIERIRDDKTNSPEDVGLNQITRVVYLEETEVVPQELPSSEILLREVYQKTEKDKIMVQKFMVWKTNKEAIDSRYPAYVFNYTNFSSKRKDPLQREIRISNSKDQIMELAKQFIADNVKKGWIKVEGK